MSGGTLDSLGLFRISSTGPLPSSVCISIQLRLCFHSLLSVLNPESKLSVWALPISLAATLGIDVSFFSYGYLDVSVPRVASCITIYSLYGNCSLLQLCSHIRISMARRSLAPYHSFSQLTTSFFGSYCQGIHLMLFFA